MTSQATPPTHVEPNSGTRLEDWPLERERDSGWLLTERVVRGRQFSRAPLLSKFLLHIVAETLEGRAEQITEHQIGVEVFGRPASYRTVEDNIVRNYARQLRRRLADHFAAHPEEEMCIEIPLGGYVPTFTVREMESKTVESTQSPESIHALSTATTLLAESETPSNAFMRKASRIWIIAVSFVAYSVLLIGLTWLLTHQRGESTPPAASESILWQTLFSGTKSTYIVPPDAGFNLIEDLSHHPVSLADYIQGGYTQIPLQRFDAHSAQDLRMHEFTDFVDMQIITSLTRLPEYNTQHVSLRYPRDLRLDDLKNSNALIIGSVCSNPWASLADSTGNFQIVCSETMMGSSIVNKSPRPGEQLTYESHWNEPTHTTYALIRLVPNLSGDGYLLLLEGLDVAGTQAAAEALLHSDAVAQIIRQAKRSNGTLGYFEILLRSTSIESNATGTEIIASRIRRS